MSKVLLTIIIVSYNTKSEIKFCLESIYKNNTEKNFEIIVIDNNSSDSSTEMIKKNFEHVILIENDQNLGFAKAVNQGLRAAKGDFYLLLNPDTKINELKSLLEFAKDKIDLGVVGPRLVNSDETIQASCFNLPSIRNAILEFWFGQKGKFGKFSPKTNNPVEVESVVGAVMLIPKKSLKKVGFFDERYFMYFEDLDWCRRARKLNLKIWYYPQVKFFHQHGASGKDISEKTKKWLIESSKIYYGRAKYYLITFIIMFGQKIRGKWLI